MGNFNSEKFTCSACHKEITEDECNDFNGFCSECDTKGWHYCEDCGKPIQWSRYSNEFKGLVCKECGEKYDNE